MFWHANRVVTAAYFRPLSVSKTMIRTAIFALVLTFGISWTPTEAQACSASDAAEAAAGELPADATVAKFSVTGMTCGSCALKIKASVEALQGVTIAKVHMDGTMEVAYDTKLTNVDAIVEAVKKLKKYTVKQA